MKARELTIEDFRDFNNSHILIGECVTAIAGNNGTGKSTILGLLANSSWLRGHKTYLGKPYRGEFSELFSASPEDDPTGKKITLAYQEHGIPQTMGFRTGWQKKETGEGRRFRVIPHRKGEAGKIVESKLSSPVIYLGLSRLYPIGEADEGGLGRKTQKWDEDEDEKWFKEKYSHILSIHDNIKSVDSLDIGEVSRKRGTGIATEKYGSTANSAGQDNMGQILLAMLSFRKLKRDMGSAWDGGLLLIDEVDATLHPAAQLRLIDLMMKEAEETGYQVAFTTHSTVILEKLCEKNQYNKDGVPGKVEVAYLTDANRRLTVKRNPTWHTMECDLLVRGRGSGASVGVFSEDGQARWLIKEILSEAYPSLLSRVSLIEEPFGCGQLLRLYEQDFQYLKDRIIVLDGDVSEEEINSKVSGRKLKSGKNLIKLPGTVRPENIIWNYLSEAQENDPVWDALAPYEITWRTVLENGPDSDEYCGLNERNRYKRWFEDYVVDFSQAKVIHHWMGANPGEGEAFANRFLDAYNAVARRTSAVEMPMAKSN